MAEKTTYFGFKTIRESEKGERVREVFSSVAAKYDLMNDLMSFGLHRAWKREFVAAMQPRAKKRLLDVAGGTGDIAFRFIDAAGEGAQAIVLDMTDEMLAEGKRRAKDRGMIGRIDWVEGDAMALPFEDRSFDIYSISFGLRNVTDIDLALREAWRVLDYGGRIMVLEFSQLPEEALQWAYDRYSFNAIPLMGEMVAKDRASYRYLVESIRRHPPQEKLAHMMAEAGFARVSYRNLSFGVAAIHSGWKI